MRLYGRRLYLPAISIIVVVVLLLGIIGVSTYRNWHRERQMTLSYIHGRGITLIRDLEAGARSGMMMHLWSEDSIGSLIHEMAQTDDVLYILLFDGQGRILHHSEEVYLGQMAHWRPRLSQDRPIASRIRRTSGRPMVYEMAKTFSPMKMMMHSRVHPDDQAHSHSGDTLVVGLDMTRYEASQKEDLQHALVMGGILVVLGSGVLFFVFVIQNYYLVNRSLKASQDFNRLVLNSMADGLISIDSGGSILIHNGQAAKLLGYPGESIEGRKLSAIIDLTESGIQSTLTKRQFLLNHEIRHEREPGREVVIGLTVSPLSRDNAETRGAVLVLRDLTQVKRLAQQVRQSEKLAAVGALAAGVAHEIRNPLSSIRGFAQFLHHRLKDRTKEQEYAAVMVREIDRINVVLSDLLRLARPAKPVNTPTSLPDLLHHVLKLVAGDAQKKRIILETAISDNLPEIRLDTNQITQALLNLLQNALHATPLGGSVVMGAHFVPDKSEIGIWVKDSGPGVPTEERNRIFEPFFTTREEGTGLGLAIVDTIVSQHGGRIDVESPAPHESANPGSISGCCFTLWLPSGNNQEVT